jgi:RNA polymerase sigma-70 factor (ECF subfamily)
MASTRTAASLYEAHRDMVYHLCLRYGGGNISWAEDATQDVFIKMLEHLSTLSDHDDLGKWLYRVTVNTCLTRLKREGSVWGRVRQALTASSETADRRTPERSVQLRHDLGEALAALERLPAKERVVFTMKHLDNLPQQEIAAALDLSEGYVSKLLHRALARLQKHGKQGEVRDA